MTDNHIPTAADFQLWLDQPIWVTDCEKMTRRETYPEIAEEITRFLKSRGYTMDSAWGRGYRALARWAYQIHSRRMSNDKGRALILPDVLHRNWPEDYEQFHHTISSDDVMDLFESWRHIEDFDLDSPLGQDLMMEFSSFLYRYLNLDVSKQGEKIARLFDSSDSDSDAGWLKRKRPGRQTDIYLIEARQGMHGGKGWKV